MSRVGDGTTATVHLPVVDVQADGASPADIV